MRITTNSMVRNYNSSLSSSLNNLNFTRERVASGRLFNRAYQDPSAALRAADLQRQYLSTEDYIGTVKNTQSRQDSVDSTMQQLVETVRNACNDESLKAINGTTDYSTRQTYAASLRQMQQSLIQFSSSTYNDKYLFAGADGKNIPFQLDEATGAVTYRGINVTTGEWPGHTNAEGLDELKRLADEKLYIDIGLGLQVDAAGGIATSADDINGASAYNIAISGIRAMGFGSTTDTPPISKNIIALVGQMADELEKPDGPGAGTFDADNFRKMREQMDTGFKSLTDYNADVGVRSKFLESTLTRLENDKLNIYTQLDATAYIKPEAAITDYSYSMYAYNTLLKVGTSLLSNSFIDYMK